MSDWDISCCAASISRCIARRSEEAIGADAATGLVDHDTGPTVCTGKACLTAGQVWRVVLVFAWKNDQGYGNYDGRGDKQK